MKGWSRGGGLGGDKAVNFKEVEGVEMRILFEDLNLRGWGLKAVHASC